MSFFKRLIGFYCQKRHVFEIFSNFLIGLYICNKIVHMVAVDPKKKV